MRRLSGEVNRRCAPAGTLAPARTGRATATGSKRRSALRTKWIAAAYCRRGSHAVLLVLAAFCALGALVHVGNLLGFGELAWHESPLTWKIGDIWWGALEIAAVAGIVARSPVGIAASMRAATSQVLAYGVYSKHSALSDDDHAMLRGLVLFSSVVPVILAMGLLLAGRRDD